MGAFETADTEHTQSVQQLVFYADISAFDYSMIEFS